MNKPTLLTIGHFFPNRTVVIWEGEKEIAAVFGNSCTRSYPEP